VGEVIAAALDAGCREILLGVGGSASTDGGAGLVSALGARVLDAGGEQLVDGGLALADVARLDLSALHPAVGDAEVTVACDVDNPLTGPSGAAAVYGPQKGADPELVDQLDRGLSRWADVVAATIGSDHRDRPGAGAAGGLAFGAVALLGAELRTGAEVVQELTGLEAALAGVDLVVTGEGSLDDQTLRGKAPAGVAAAARRAGIPVVAVAGRCLLDDSTLADAGIASIHTLLDEASSEEEAFEKPGPLLERIGARIAREELAPR
jgi:glycerate kinase